MNKLLNTLSWVLIGVGQIGVSYLLITLATLSIFQTKIVTMQQFIMVPLSIWGSYVVGVFGVGMLGLKLQKVKPLVPGLRLAATAVTTALPMFMLGFNAAAVGVQNQPQFQDIVIVRMVPYYTELCAVFALLGFFVTVWWNRVVPKKGQR